MKSIVIFYFSGTGNTWWVSDKLFKHLTALGNRVGLFSIEAISRERVDEEAEAADHIVLGFPAYGSTAPMLMREFINALPPAKPNQAVSVFATHALASGDTSYHIGQWLISKGYELKHAAHFRMMNNLHIPRFRFYKPRNDHKLENLLQNVLPKVKWLAELIHEDKTYIIGHNPLGHLLGNIQRKHIDALIASANDDFKVDKSRCIDCKKCVNICPVQNISCIEGSYSFGKNCILCMRCYSQCPKAAVLIGEGSKDENKFPRFKGPGDDFDIKHLTCENHP